MFCCLWTSQKLNWQNSFARNLMPEHFLAITLWHRHSTRASHTPEGLHQIWALPQHKAIFFEWLGIQFFNSHSHVTYRDAMPRQGPLTLLPSQAKDVPRVCHHSGHMPLLTYLAWLQPIYYDPRLVFKHVKIKKRLLVVKNSVKNIEQQPH